VIPLTDKQRQKIEEVLQRLREHYPPDWPGNAVGFEYDLVAFAIYEGHDERDACCRELIAEAAPFALGRALVGFHGFQWATVITADAWHFAVTHPALDCPIDLESLEDGSWNEEEYDQPPSPGRTTLDSLETIVRRVRSVTG
jgi:hypothetical protein